MRAANSGSASTQSTETGRSGSPCTSATTTASAPRR
jgi:hypothetical protein